MEMTTPVVFEAYSCAIKTKVASKHKTKPIKGMVLWAPVSFDNRKPTRFTTPKISKKPTLPAVEMLSNSNTITKNNVLERLTIPPLLLFPH